MHSSHKPITAHSRSVTLTEAQWTYATALGNGNATKGIKRALRISSSSGQQLTLPLHPTTPE